MNIEEFRNYCLQKPFTTEEFPFNNETLVFKVKGKIFALTTLNKSFSINLKCTPTKALKLREKYTAITPGFHMNKMHWNTILVDGSFSKTDLLAWIDQSYDLVVLNLTKKEQNEILNSKS